MDEDLKVSFLIDNLNQAKLDKAVDEYFRCEDLDDFSKYESLRGFSKPKNYLYTPNRVHRFWIRALMAIAYFQEFDEVLDRKAKVDGANTKQFGNKLVKAFNFHVAHEDDKDASSLWQALEGVREGLKSTRILELDDIEYEAQEGKQVVVTHKVRERDPHIVSKKKLKVLGETGKLACEVCSFDFRSTYGGHGDRFTECHHIEPLSTPDRGPITSLADLAIVCANCHRMLHRGNPWPSLSDLKNLIKQNSDQS
jgi:predicted HNH restriction endonuclease